MKDNALKAAFTADQKAVGAIVYLDSYTSVDILKAAGMDFVVFDTEHGPYDVETTERLIIDAEAKDITPLVRVKDAGRSSVMKMLDIGAMGIIIPYIHSVDEIREVIRYGKYRPVGDRGYGTTRKNCYGLDPLAANISVYFEWANRETLIIPQCETMGALNNIEEITALPGVDGILVGPFDLSVSMGIPGQFERPEFAEALQKVLSACKKNGKFCLYFTLSSEDAKKKLQLGFDGILGSDAMFLYNGASEYLSRIKASL